MRNVWCTLSVIGGISFAAQSALGSDCDIEQVYNETVKATISEYRTIDKRLEHFPEIAGGKCVITGVGRIGSSWYQAREYGFWTEDMSARQACKTAEQRVKTTIATENRPLVVRSHMATLCKIVDGKIIKKPDEKKWTWNECRQVKSRRWWGYNYPDPCKDLFKQLDDGRRKGYPPQSR